MMMTMMMMMYLFLQPHAPFDMHDTNAPSTPRLPRELRNLETFYNPKPGDKSTIALLTHDDTICVD